MQFEELRTPEGALGSLLEELPQALLRQYEYEDNLVRAGQHLMHSDFFKVCTIFSPKNTSEFQRITIQFLRCLYFLTFLKSKIKFVFTTKSH